MSNGKAHGPARDYQVLCQKILQSLPGAPSLKPYSGDGIDVQFKNVGGTGVTFDVALENPSGGLVVAECRSGQSDIEQEDLFAFARKVELLRKATRREVSAAFFSHSKYQIGALKHGTWSEIDVAVLDAGQIPPDFVLVYHRYDFERERRIRQGLVRSEATANATLSAARKIIRQDGTTEDLGDA